MFCVVRFLFRPRASTFRLNCRQDFWVPSTMQRLSYHIVSPKTSRTVCCCCKLLQPQSFTEIYEVGKTYKTFVGNHPGILSKGQNCTLVTQQIQQYGENWRITHTVNHRISALRQSCFDFRSFCSNAVQSQSQPVLNYVRVFERHKRQHNRTNVYLRI